MTRDDLRNADDVWGVVHQHIGLGINDLELWLRKFFREQLNGIDAELEEKFRKGEAEHKRAWLAMTEADLANAIREELLDAINYAAMARVLRNADQEASS